MKALWTTFLFAGIGGCTTHTTSPPIVEEPQASPPSMAEPARTAQPTATAEPEPAPELPPAPRSEPATAATSSPPTPRGPECNPIEFTEAQPGFKGTIDGDNTLDDLDGDGIFEHGVVATIGQAPEVESHLTIVSPRADGTCTKLYSGPGSGVEGLESRTVGWRDVALEITLSGPMAWGDNGQAKVHMTFAGGRYQWRQVKSCEIFRAHQQLGAAECRSTILGMKPRGR